MKKLRLTPFEREFLSRVTRVIYANPFSDERVQAEKEIIDSDPSESYEERTKKIIHILIQNMERLVEQGKDDIRKFSGRDRRLY